MDGYVLHLAMAALVGASAVAISAYFMHRKTLSQLLDFAHAFERHSDVDDHLVSSSAAAVVDFPDHLRSGYAGRLARRKGNGYRRRGSASLPDVTSISGDGEEKRNGPVTVQGIPAGLPRLHALHEGIFVFGYEYMMN